MTMKLSFKIALGFIIILIISGVIGVIAVINMLNIQTQSTELSQAYIPEVQIATDLERNSLMVMYNIRGYGFTEDEKYLTEGRAYLTKVNESLKNAEDLSKEFAQLAILAENVKIAKTNVSTYETLVQNSQDKIKALNNYRNLMNSASDIFIKNAGDYLTAMNNEMAKEFKDGSTLAQLESRLGKISKINEVIDLNNEIRVANFKAQATDDIVLFEGILKNFDEITNLINELKTVTVQDVNKQQLDSARTSGADYKNAMSMYLTAWKELNTISSQREGAANKVLEAAQATSEGGLNQTDSVAKEAVSSLASSTVIVIVGLLLAVIIGIILAFVVIRSITKPVTRIVNDLNQGSDQVASASEQLSSASQQLAEGSSEQASALEETSATLNESTSMIQQTTENTNQASILSRKTKDSAATGNSQMKEMMSSMREIKKSSDEISKIIKVIDDIAFQTNILSLNAAVEAARAGEAGAGFAVVAEEVRNLAQRSAQAAKDTASIIERNIQLSQNGVSVAEKVGVALGEINEHATKVNSLIDEINAASNEQAQGINQINTALAQMEQVTQGNAANAEESASASEELSAQAESMREIVGQLNKIVTGKDDLSAVSSGRKPSGGGRMQITAAHHAPVPAPKPRTAMPGNNQNIVARKPKQGSTKVVNPEQVIPLEDDTADF